MQTISHQEFLTFIFSQPRDRLVNMNQSFARDGDCGCMMVQLGRERGFIGNILAGFVSCNDKQGHRLVLENDVTVYFPKRAETGGWRVYTYGEIQDYLTEKGMVPEKAVDNE